MLYIGVQKKNKNNQYNDDDILLEKRQCCSSKNLKRVNLPYKTDFCGYSSQYCKD